MLLGASGCLLLGGEVRIPEEGQDCYTSIIGCNSRQSGLDCIHFRNAWCTPQALLPSSLTGYISGNGKLKTPGGDSTFPMTPDRYSKH